MPTFRPYSNDELRRAAQAYNLDPDFVEAVYAVESSRGTNPKAMTARPVKRSRDTTIVRGPFQLEDDTTSDLIRKHKLGNVNVDDPDVHLDLALRLMRDLKDTYGGDYRKVAQAYLGGPGGVTNSNAKDELGTSTGSYGNKILAEMNALKGAREPDAGVSAFMAHPGLAMDVPEADLPMPDLPLTPFGVGADAGESDAFGVPDSMLAMSNTPDRVAWTDLTRANRSDGLGLTPEMGSELPNPEPAMDEDITQYLRQLVNEELDGKQYASAA